MIPYASFYYLAYPGRSEEIVCTLSLTRGVGDDPLSRIVLNVPVDLMPDRAVKPRGFTPGNWRGQFGLNRFRIFGEYPETEIADFLDLHLGPLRSTLVASEYGQVLARTIEAAHLEMVKSRSACLEDPSRTMNDFLMSRNCFLDV